MEEKTVISIDAMGGAAAPESVVEGVSIVCKKYSDIFILLHGDEKKIISSLEKFSVPDHMYCIIATEQVVSDDDKPLFAWRNGKESSMRKAIDAVGTKEAHACVSCGNTGALMLIAKMVLGSLGNIKRPAICASFPTVKNGNTVILDMGANTECDEINFFHFALMGSCFAKIILRLENPSIAILNVGIEKTKGRSLEKKAYTIFDNTDFNFLGFIEANNIIEGKADVVVTDGFSGNILLKSSEGAVRIFFDLLKKASSKNMLTKLGAFLLKRQLKSYMKIIDPDKNNGAILLGVDGIVVKSHGAAKPSGIANAIEVAYRLSRAKINETISLKLNEFEKQGIGVNLVSKIKQTSAKIFGINK